MDDTFDVDLLCRRSEYLDALGMESRSKAELVDDLGVSRSTVNRVVSELAEAGLVDDAPGACRLTLTGRLAAESHAEFNARTQGLGSARDLIEHVGPDAEFGPEIAHGADVYLARGSRPYRAFHAFERLIREATRLRGSARTFANPRGRDLFEDAIVERGVPVEFVLDRRLYDEMLDDFADAFERWRATGRFDGLVAEGCPRYSLLLSELPAGREMAIAVYTADLEFRGVLINGSPDAVAWAEDRLDELTERGTPLVEGAGQRRRGGTGEAG